jgi:hypothetical protein
MFGSAAKRTFFPMSTFLQVVELLLTNDNAKADYANDPSSFLNGHGLGSFDSADVADAMGHAAEALPMSVAVQLDPNQGLDSAAGLDLEAQGLSLDREPIGGDEYDDDNITDADLDPYGADADVDFDAPDGDGDGAEVVDALDAADTSDAIEVLGEEAIEDLEPLDEVDTTPEADTTPEIDTGDYLTDIPFDLPGQDSPLDTEQLEESGAGLNSDSIDDLDAEVPDDLPDDLDLLD